MLVDWRHNYPGLVPSCYMLSQELSSDPRALIERDSKSANSKEQDFLIFFFKTRNKTIYKHSSQRDIN